MQHLLAQMAQMVKNLPGSAGDPGSIPGLGRSPGGGNGNPLQYSYLDRGESRGQRSLVGYSPWDRKESDTPERLTLSIEMQTENRLMNTGRWVEEGEGGMNGDGGIYSTMCKIDSQWEFAV